MNELFYNIKLTFWFIIVMSFVGYRNIKLEYMTNMQTVWFLSVDRDYTVSTASVDYDNDDWSTIYIFKNDHPRDVNSGCLSSTIPPECSTENSRKSIRCLRLLKEKSYWYVNWLYFSPSDKNCLSVKNKNSYN